MPARGQQAFAAVTRSGGKLPSHGRAASSISMRRHTGGTCAWGPSLTCSDPTEGTYPVDDQSPGPNNPDASPGEASPAATGSFYAPSAGAEEPSPPQEAGEDADGAAAEAAPEPPEAPTAPATSPPPSAGGPGQRRITRYTTTSTTRTETSTDETIVEDVQMAPPVWAASSGEHPRPVG